MYSEVTEPNEVPKLIKLLKTGKAEARINAAYKLGLLWPQQNAEAAVAALIKAMEDPSENVRSQAASSLGELKAEDAVNVLTNAALKQNPEVALFAAQSLGQIGSAASSSVPVLLILLENKSCGVRKVAAIALAKIGISVEKAVPVMIKDLNLSNYWSRYEAALALGYMGQIAQPAIPALKKLLNDSSWDVQQQACRTLRNIGTPDARNALKTYPELCDSRANENISEKQHIAMLIEDLSLPKEFSRVSAAYALGIMGKNAQAAIPALKLSLKDQSVQVQQEACNSLRKIGTKEAFAAIKEFTGDCSSGFR
jgi:HEAT repeat protein